MTKTVSAYEARTNLGELINLAYYQGAEIVVKRMGKPMVKIVRIDKDEKKQTHSRKTQLSRKARIRKNIKKVQKLAGGFKLGKGLTVRQINRIINEQYERKYAKMLSGC